MAEPKNARADDVEQGPDLIEEIGRAQTVEKRPRPAPVAPARKPRPCPECGKALEWAERARLYGTEYDYYRWCGSGCGLYCYDRHLRTWVKLA